FPRKLPTMLRAKLSAVPLLVSAVLISGCSVFASDDEKAANMSPAKLYAEARDEMSSGAFDKAVPLLEKLEGRAAGTPLAQQAQLEKAYAQYKSNDQASALSTIERFLKQHPASPAVDYALYLRGIVNFNDNLGPLSFITRQDLSERD